jgi:hypothetical protein
MCLHKSFENVTLKVGDWGQSKNIKLNYCDGSRNHGCDGCFCRHPNYHPSNNGQCEQCGKYLFELLDLLWESRQQVYREKKFTYVDWDDLFNMEIAIEERLRLKMVRLYNYSAINLSRTMGRSDLLRIFKIHAEAAATDIIREEKLKRGVAYDLDVESSSEESSSEDSGYETEDKLLKTQESTPARNDSSCDECGGACWTIVNIETGESREQLNKCRRHDSSPSSLAGK